MFSFFRMWVLKSQGQDYRKKSSKSTQELPKDLSVKEDERSLGLQPASEKELEHKSKLSDDEIIPAPQPLCEREEDLKSKEDVEDENLENLEPQPVSENKVQDDKSSKSASEEGKNMEAKEAEENKDVGTDKEVGPKLNESEMDDKLGPQPGSDLKPVSSMDLKSSEGGKGGEGDSNLGPQHAELLVRLFKMCSEEVTSAMILRLCGMSEQHRMVLGKEVKACPDDMVTRLVERLNNMDKEQMNFVLDTEGELASIVEEVAIMNGKETTELEEEIDQRVEAPYVSTEVKVGKIKLDKTDVEEFVEKVCTTKKSIRIYKKPPDEEVVEIKKEKNSAGQKKAVEMETDPLENLNENTND